MLRISALAALALVPALALACSSASTSNNATGDDADSGNADAGGGDDGSTTDGGPKGDTCEVTKQGKSGLVLQGTVLAPSGVIDSGEVLVDGDGKIVCADTSCASSSGYKDATVLACPGGVISPGLINGHDHTEYNLKGPLTHGDTRWQHRNGWRTGAGGEQKLPSVSKTSDDKAVAASELRFVLGGATSTNGSGGVGGLLRNLAAYKNKEQLEGLSGATTFFDTFPLGDSDGTELTSGCGYPSIRSAGSAFAGGAAYTPHVSEGINAAAENEFACIKDSLIKGDTAIIHGVGWTANDADVVAKAGAKVIWSPRTNIDLYGNTAPITLLKNDGVTIALGTDWLASGSMNMLRELACVDSVNQKYFAKAFDDKAIWEMATKNTAIATKFDSQIGSLTPGLFADIAVFSRASGDGYRAVIGAGVEDVLLVLRGGKPLYGEAAILDKLDGSCSALDVCGKKKEVCVDTPNVSLDDITGVADANYPLFFCKDQTPTDEPSCVPYRDTYPDGTSATDRDGDGVADGSDDCPDVFNPPRPMDGANQSDADNDGVGDACDAKPLDPQSH